MKNRLSALAPSRELSTFFDNLDSFAEAPEGVAKLRELILDLAVRGKLVDQDKSNEPASELLATIHSHKQAFIEENNLKRVRKLAEVIDTEQPFPAPVSWIWCRLGDVARPQAGFAFKSSLFNENNEGVPLIRIRDILNDQTQVHYAGDYRDEFLVETGDYLIGMDGNFNVAKWQGPQALLNQRVTRLQWYSDLVEQRFVTIALQHRLFELQGKKAYTTVDHLSGKQIEDSPIPLPPLSEQRRIVAKVDGLMSLCDELESLHSERVRLRDRASRSCLDRLVSSRSRRDLSSAWQRLIDDFEVLYDTPETLAHLRQSIVQLAVQGKLLSLTDEDKKLLARDSMVGDFLTMQNGYAFKSEWFEKSGIRLVRNANIGHGELDWTDVAMISVRRAEEYERFDIREGDIVLSLDRPLISTGLKVARITKRDLPSLLLQRVARPVFKDSSVRPDYFYMWLQSPAFTESIDPGKSNGIPHISTREVQKIAFAPPTTASQKRIVAKVDQLLSQCDELSARLRDRQSATQQLLTATIDHLLNG